MALKPIPGFIAGSYPSRARGASARRTVNGRIERNQDPNSKSPYTWFPRCGKKLFKDLPLGPNEGCWSNKTRPFFVSGGHFYELHEDKTVTDFGVLDVGTNPATMRANINQVLICSAGKVYVATGTTFYQPIINFANGFVSITGNALTWISGDKFLVGGDGDIVAGDMVQLGANTFTVLAVADDEHLTLDGAPGDSVSERYLAGNEFLTGATVEFIDGYFIVNVPNTKIFRISNPEDGTKWDDLDKQEKSGSLDNIARVMDLGGQLALIGDNNSTEIWGDSGNADFPFQRINGRSMNCGTAAAWSVAKLTDGSLCWLISTESGENMVVRTLGGEPQRISDHALENAMENYPLTYDAVSSTYLVGGHSCLRIDFPTANASWEFDATEGIWTEQGVATADDEVYGQEPGRYMCHVTWPSGKRMLLAGDAFSGKVWEVASKYLDDDGVDFPVMIIAPHINSNLERATVPKFALDCELGTIDPTLKGPDEKELIPTVSMFYSADGANTWMDAGAASLGRSGEYEGMDLNLAEAFDVVANSQTNPQVFYPIPQWDLPGSFWIAFTIKIKSTGKMLRAVYNGLIEVTP